MEPPIDDVRKDKGFADKPYKAGDPNGRCEEPHSRLSKPWIFLAVLTLLHVFLSLDRNLFQILAEPIKSEFALSDSELGLLLGLAFGLPYGIMCILLSPVIDRVRRTRFLAILLALWSLATFATGLASSFLSLFLARAGLGAAEAGGSPTSISMLADKFPPKRRATAIGIFHLGTPAGHVAAGLITAIVVVTFDWRVAFMLAGIPGLLLALFIAFRLPEPERGALDIDADTAPPKGYFGAMRYILGDRVAFPYAVGNLLLVLSGSAFLSFVAPLLQRTHGLDLKLVALILSAGSVIAIASPIVMGVVADRLMAYGTHALAAFMASLVAVIVPVTLLSSLSPLAGIAGGAVVFWHLLQYGTSTPSVAGLVAITPPNIRGGVISLLSAGSMTIGFGLGPVLVGLCSDYLQSLPQSIAIVSGCAGILSASLYALAAYRLWPKSSITDRRPL